MEKINLSRLKNCMARAQRGEELTIGFLGGSITQEALPLSMRIHMPTECLPGGRKPFQMGNFTM